MAQSNDGFAEVIKFALIGGAAWVAWSLYQSYLAGQAAATAPGATPPAGTPPTTTTAATPPAATVTLSIPSNLSVTSDINNALKGMVNVNGQLVSIDVIPSAAGQPSGVVWNSSGDDVTSMFTPAQITQLITAYSLAPKGVSGLRGFGGPGRNYVRAGAPMIRTINYRRAW